MARTARCLSGHRSKNAIMKKQIQVQLEPATMQDLQEHGALIPDMPYWFLKEGILYGPKKLSDSTDVVEMYVKTELEMIFIIKRAAGSRSFTINLRPAAASDFTLGKSFVNIGTVYYIDGKYREVLDGSTNKRQFKDQYRQSRLYVQDGPGQLYINPAFAKAEIQKTS